jgi:heme A synthase
VGNDTKPLLSFGVIPHLSGAMIVSFATLVAATFVRQQYPEHRALRSSSTWLIAILLAQVILGVSAFAIQLLDLKDPIVVIVVTAAHVVFGPLTLAACLLLAMQLQRHVRPAGLAKRQEKPGRQARGLATSTALSTRYLNTRLPGSWIVRRRTNQSRE